ncbi:hypothetical protein YC2023_098301 [Brassica napus]
MYFFLCGYFLGRGDFFIQFTAAARYIWGGSGIHSIHYEVSENTSDVVYKIIDSLCSRSIGPESETMIWPTVKDDAKPSSSSSSFFVTALNAQRSCKASATSTTRHPATSNRFDYLIHSPIMC